MGDLVDTELRPAIAQSWQRSDVVGLPPDSTLDHLVPVDVDPRSSLLAAASPVLEELDEQLRDTRYGTLLVDRECRVVRRAFDDSRLLDALDDLGRQHPDGDELMVEHRVEPCVHQVHVVDPSVLGEELLDEGVADLAGHPFCIFVG